MTLAASPPRRLSPRLLPLLAALLALTVLAPAGPGGRPAAQAQSPAPPQVTVDLYSSSLLFRTLPATLVTAELTGPKGRKAEGVGVGDAQGVAQVGFYTGETSILPGDTIVLSRANDKPLHLTVPQLAASLVELPTVEGIAPPGVTAQLSLKVQGSPAAIEKQVVADSQGAFTVDLSAQLSDPDAVATGSLTYDSPEGGRFVLALATVDAQITLGAPALRGRVTAGWEVSATVTAAGGSPVKIGPVTAGGDGSFLMSLQPLGRPIAVGDNVDLRATGGGQHINWFSHHINQVKDITVTLDRSSDLATGTAPAGEAVILSAEDMDGRQELFRATADGAGAFSVAMAPRVDLGSGWRVRAAYPSSSNVSVGRLAVLPRVRVGVDLPISQGLAEPGRMLTVTLRSAAGAIKAQSPTQADDQGRYQLYFFGAPGSVPQAGDSLEIAFADNLGDPLLLRVPELTAVSDVDSDAVGGRAPADSVVTVRVDGAGGPKRFTATADSGGAYRAALAGQLDLKRPANGAVTVAGGSNAEFTTSWAAVQLNVSVGSTIQGNFVFGNGPAWRTVYAELQAPDGKVVGSGNGQVFGGDGVFFIPGGSGSGPQFFMQLADVTGTPIEMQTGDKLQVTVGAELLTLTVPPLDSVAFVQSDRITGRTAPDTRVTLSVADSPLYFDMTVETRSDAAGNFSHDFSGKRNIRHGDFIQISADIGGHNVSDVSIAPGLLMDLDQAVLLGSIAPNLDVTVTLKRGASTLSRQNTSTDANGAMFAQFADDGGAPLRLQVGDVVTVTASDPTQDPLSLTVPDLSFSWDIAADTVSGSAPAQGQLTLFASLIYPVAGTLGISQGWPSVQAGNRFSTEFVPSIDVRPGSRFTLLYRPPQGHYVVRSRTVPILNAQHSGPNACGFGTPYEPVSVKLEAGGAQLAAAAAEMAPYDGFFGRLLLDAVGKAVKTAAGQRESAQLGGPSAAIDLPVFDLAVDWNTQQVTGKGPAGGTYYVQPAQPCAAQRPQGILNFGGGFFAFDDQTEADGSFDTFLPGGAAPGSGVEIAFYAPDGQRYFRQAYRALARIYIHTDRVTGQANPLDNATVILKGAASQERSRATAAANGDGAFGLRLPESASGPERIEAGDIVTLEAGGQSAEITVEPLSFDWSEGAAIFGQAPANRPVQLRLRLKSGATYSIPRQSDAGGRFSFKDDEVPVRGGWTLADVAAVRLELTTPSGHLIIDQTPSWTNPPTQQQPVIYLPAAFRGASPRGTAAQAADGRVRRASGAAWRPVPAPRTDAGERSVLSAERKATWRSFLGSPTFLPTGGRHHTLPLPAPVAVRMTLRDED